MVASGRTAQGAKSAQTGQLTPAQLLVKGAITHVEDKTTGGGGGLRVKGFRVGGKKSNAEINATVYVVDSTTGMVLASTNVVGTSASKGASFGYTGGTLACQPTCANWDLSGCTGGVPGWLCNPSLFLCGYNSTAKATWRRA